MNVTLGGDRIGSGNKNKIYLHNYEMSTHNLSKRVTTTASPGILYPIYCVPAMRGDTFDIKINAQARTIPTRGPMFSTFKMQVDMYEVSMRLYQALLHNNPTKLGLNMAQVKLPKLDIQTAKSTGSKKWENGEFANNCLLKYLGMSGIGTPKQGGDQQNELYARLINATPPLGYFDIFKNYYANKQEDMAYQIGINKELVRKSIGCNGVEDGENNNYPISYLQAHTDGYMTGFVNIYDQTLAAFEIACRWPVNNTEEDILKWARKYMRITLFNEGQEVLTNTFETYETAGWLKLEKTGVYIFTITTGDTTPTITHDKIVVEWENFDYIYNEEIALKPFKLSNIDNMRMDILSFHSLGESFIISDENAYPPYETLINVDSNQITLNKKPMNGLVVKTYQSDVYNNWLNAEWIEGENGIAEMTKIAVSDGSVYIDDLIMAKKTYELLNRVAVADGTYQAWLDVVYQESPNKHLETPMFIGGLSSEIVFEEIVQTAPTNDSALGSLGGRGLMVKRLGGQCYVKVDEPAFIMGILSLTPRIFYSQGNAFYMTELDSIDDLHKPAFDGIGFQDLIGETMCWTDTIIADNGTLTRTSVGKVPAWIMYQTAVDEVYGEFCDVDKQGYMVLNRNYNVDDNGVVQDFTTYIDPAKYNYVWADSSLLSQNFWVQVQFDVKARRKMSARQIPNL